MVLSVLHALQGHPECSTLWECHVFDILKSLGFTTTTHKRCLYRSFHQGKEIFTCHQVDDFKVAGPDEETIQDLINAIGGEIQLTVKKELLTHYNGI
eukprot:13186777-Ditylum_brightwellii.AAC.1